MFGKANRSRKTGKHHGKQCRGIQFPKFEQGIFYKRGHGLRYASIYNDDSDSSMRTGRQPDSAGVEGLCPLCKNKCPLNDPTCQKGAAYAASMHHNRI